MIRTDTPAAAALRSPPGRVLTLLLLAYILNYLDRQILGILATPIKADLGLSDTQFGAIGGLAFALLYATLGVPLSYLADRTSRSGVIAASLAVWSAFTGLCGLAGGFWQLLLCRLGVGVGEAGGVAPSYALLADYYPPHRRARALAIYSLGVPIGLGAGSLIGAYIAAALGWQWTFFVLGAVGLAFAPLFRLLVRDAPSAGREVLSPAELRRVFPIIARKRSFWLMAFAASCSSLTGYGLAIWTPSILMRNFGLDLVETGQFTASLLLTGGILGVFAGGWLADRLGQADKRWYARLPAIAWLITAPTFAVGLLAPNLTLAWVLLFIPNALNILWLGPVTTAVQHIVPRPMRASASASFLFINNLIGLGVGPLLIGALSDGLKASYGVESLRYAAVGCLGFYLVAALLMSLAARRLTADWVDD